MAKVSGPIDKQSKARVYPFLAITAHLDTNRLQVGRDLSAAIVIAY